MQADDLSSIDLDLFRETKGWQNQFRLISLWGQLIQTKPDLRIPENRLSGCEVAAWLAHRKENGQHHFLFDSESRLIKGLAAMILSLCENKTTESIVQQDLHDTLLKLGVIKHLSPSRNNGIKALITQIHCLITYPQGE